MSEPFTIYVDPNITLELPPLSLLDSPRETPRRRQDEWPPFIGGEDRKAPRPPKEWEIEPFFYRKSRVILYGESGSGKSVILMHMGVSLAAGLPWFGRYSIKEPRNVLYIDKENGEDLAIERCNRIEATLDVDTGDRLKIWADPDFMMNEHDPKALLDRFERIDWKPDIILVDGFRRVLYGEENSSDDVNPFWNNVATLRVAGITTVFLHHTNRGGQIRGSGDIFAGADKIFELSNSNNSCTLKPVKERTGKTAPTIDARIEGGKEETSSLNVVLAQERGQEEGGEDSTNKIQQAFDAAYAFLSQQPGKRARRGEIDKHLMALGHSGSSIGRALGWGREMRLLDSPKKGTWEIIPELENKIDL